MEVAITNLGAKVLQIFAPDRSGALNDVVLGYDSLSGVLNGTPSMGAFIGRYAGRIAQAKFNWHGKEHPLLANDGAHCIHGGPRGSRHRVFSANQTGPATLVLQLRFDAASDGFPGTVDVNLRYHLSDDNALIIDHEASAVHGDSPVSFTSHVFFQLDGHGATGIDHQQLQVCARQGIATDAHLVANGELCTLAGTPFDLTKPRSLGPLASLDHGFVIEAGEGQALKPCAQLTSALSGRTLEVFSTEPVIQVYAAGSLGAGAAPDLGKHGVHHRPRSAICLEPQQYPNAPNCPAFPMQRVAPGQPYRATTAYRFGTMG